MSKTSNTKDEQTAVKIFKALADQTRLSLVRELVTCPTHIKNCDELSSKSYLSQPTLSHHFSKLAEAGIIIESKIGTQKSYKLNHELMEKYGIDLSKI